MQSFEHLITQLEAMPIIFVGGKGGVGKTTTAAALAAHFATQQQKTLVISTDPAHSLGDIFTQKLNNKPTAINPYLYAIELNPDVIVDEHFAQVERTISSYANPDILPKIKQHLQLSRNSPGAQEAAMLEAICQYLVEAVKQDSYRHIIFDTAPTGHTLRLLMLPQMMEAWTEGLLTQQRRQSKLRGAADNLTPNKGKKNLVNPFTDAKPIDKWQQAVDVLNKRKNLFKQAGELLHDEHKTAIVLVLTADNLPIEETRRAKSQLREAGLRPAAFVINQLIDPEQSDEFWQKRANRQMALLKDIKRRFKGYPLYELYLQQTDIRGVGALEHLT